MDIAKKLSDELRETLQGDLIGVISYGEKSDKVSSLLLVLKAVSEENLAKMKAPIQEALKKKSIGIITLTKKELQQSADVFPIKFRTIQKYGTLLIGENPLDTLSIEVAHLRLRCEQELRNLSLRLRQTYLQRNLNSNEKINLLLSCADKFEQNLLILAELKEEKTDLDFTEAEKVLKKMDLNLSIINEIRNAFKNNITQKEQVDVLYHKFREMVDLGTNVVDQL